MLLTDGRIPSGTRLPSERELTEALDVSRTTVARAYAELRDHGFLVSRQGSGSVTRLPDSLGETTRHVLHPGDSGTGAIDLTVAAPAPGPGMLAAYERAVAELPAHLLGTGYHPTGLPVLREAVAASYAARGLPTDPAQILVVPGAQAGVAIAVRALVTTGDRVVVESPTYPNAIAALQHSGARLAGVDVPPDAATRGADVDGLDAALQQVRPRAAYLVPDFHNPTGAVLTADERARLAATMARTRTVPIVDESLVGLALDGSDDAAAVRGVRARHGHRRQPEQDPLGRPAGGLAAAARAARRHRLPGPAEPRSRRPPAGAARRCRRPRRRRPAQAPPGPAARVARRR